METKKINNLPKEISEILEPFNSEYLRKYDENKKKQIMFDEQKDLFIFFSELDLNRNKEENKNKEDQGTIFSFEYYIKKNEFLWVLEKLLNNKKSPFSADCVRVEYHKH